MNTKKKKSSGIGSLLIVVLVVVLISTFLNSSSNTKNKVYSELVADIEAGNVTELVVYDDYCIAKYKKAESLTTGEGITTDPKDEFRVSIPSVELFHAQTGEDIEKFNVKVDYPETDSAALWISLLPLIGLFVAIIIFWIFFSKQSQGGSSGGGPGKIASFGKSRAKMLSDETKKVTFADVAGVDEEKEELAEIVGFLKEPKKYTELGARIPKGVLLVGPPGTGKTLLARAVAGEAGAPFFSISGSDFVEMYVGVGASRVRDLFEQAKHHQPSIIFIDEIDAFGRQRGAGLGGGHDEREQTLNQLLVEMDGFGANEGVIVLAATNRADILDPALTRAGRFDRQVYVGAPDQKSREEILKVHAKNKPLEQDVKLEDIAKITYGFVGADLENLLNEGAILAARRGKTAIGKDELDEAMLKVVMGPEKKSRKVREKAKKMTAFHEAGHAVVTKLLPDQDPVHRVSIIPRGKAGGFTMHLTDHDKDYISLEDMKAELVILMAGRAAEKLVFGEINTGASSDIARATQIAREMVTKYGMSEKLGNRTFQSDSSEVFLGRDYTQTRSYSEEMAAAIDSEINAILKEAMDHCEQLLKDNMDILTRVAEALCEQETLDGEAFIAAFEGKAMEEDLPLADTQAESEEETE